MKEIYQDLNLFYSNKSDGNMSKKYGEEADNNRKKFIQKLGYPLNRFLLMQPDNGDNIVELKEDIIEEPDLYYKMIEADAIICKNRNVYLYLNFADCIPFVIYDQKQHIFAFAHLGWRSTYLNLHQKLLTIFKERYHSKVEDLIVYFGPSIKKESYLLETPKQKEEDVWKSYITYVKDDLYMIDLCGYVKDYFYNNGLKKIFIVPIDTGSDMNYFSHYRASHNEEIEGRFFFGVGMKEE